MRQFSIIALLLLCLPAGLKAQNEVHALRINKHNPFGTARYAAQGGAIGALGGDLSAIQVNPAGLGLYRSSEFTVTPSFYWVNNESNFLGTRVGDSRFRFNLASMGFVASRNRNRSNGFVGASYGFSYNTLVNFANSSWMTGQNDESSLLDDFTYRANQDPNNLDLFYEDVAFGAGLLPYDTIPGEYWNDFNEGGYGQEQRRIVDQYGYIGEYAFSGGLNFGNMLYLGATMGIHSVRFYEDIYHREVDRQHNVDFVDRFLFREFNTTTGWGYAFRFGMILRPFQLLRLGGSIQVPTSYYLSEEKYTDAETWWDGDTGWDNDYASSPRGVYDYRLRSPMKVNAHASMILFRFATLSAAYEYQDFSGARLDSYGDKFIDENQAIMREYRDVHNLKAGAELRFGTLYLRGGMQYLMSPYTDARNDADEWIYSSGLGVRTKRVFFDISYTRGVRSEVYGMYNPMNNAPVESYTSFNDINSNNIMFTLGLRY